MSQTAASSSSLISVLQSMRSRDDAACAEFIDSDGRKRLLRGETIALSMYVEAIPDLLSRRDVLDAALDISLRSLSGGSRVTLEAVQTLISQWPSLRKEIREAATLNATIWSTTDLRASVEGPPPKELPCEFGPITSTGERRYQLQQLLGQGGFGQVYLALDRQLSEEQHTAMVAIKILASPRDADDPTGDRSPWARQRLLEEATKARRVTHPNVVVVIDRGTSQDDEDYIVYEYVDGGDLHTIADARPLLPLHEAATLLAKIARGVHAAHSAGVIHCDLKPGNIMLTAAGEPKVADFGIAVRTTGHNEPIASIEERHPARFGNGAFISPEQYRGEPDAFSVQSDIYALGGILFLLLTGQLPNGSSPEEIAKTHRLAGGRDSAPHLRTWRREIDRNLEAICRRALSPKPAARYSSAAEFAHDLDRWRNHEPIAWTRPGLVHVVRLWTRRKPALAASLLALLLTLLAGAAVAVHLASVANQNALDAAMAQMKADQEEDLRLKSKELASRFAQSLRSTLGDYRISTESLTKIWALEYVYGPKVLGLPEEQAELWKNRIINIRQLVERARAEGRGAELETLLWESALAFWLVCDKNFEEAEPLLAENIAKWQRILPATDQWLHDLQIMASVAAVNRLTSRATTQTFSDADRSEMVLIEAALRHACITLPPDHHATPMHYLLLNGMADLNAPGLLNNPERQQLLTDRIKAYLSRKLVSDPCE